MLTNLEAAIASDMSKFIKDMTHNYPGVKLILIITAPEQFKGQLLVSNHSKETLQITLMHTALTRSTEHGVFDTDSSPFSLGDPNEHPAVN